MSKPVKRILAVVLCAALFAGAAVLAFADNADPTAPTVTYSEDNGFIFTNATSSSAVSNPASRIIWSSTTDLLASGSFKNVMPGDVTEGNSFKVSAASDNTYSYKLYMYAKVMNESYRGLLSNMSLAVKKSGSLLYELVFGTAEQKTGDGKDITSADNKILLGSFAPGQSQTFDTTLSVDINMGNEFQDAYGELNWVFVAEQIPETIIEDDPVPLNPPELDRINHFGYIIGRGYHCVQPEAEITRAEVATIFFRMLTDDSRAKFWYQTNPYSDMANDNWYNNAISTLTNSGVLDGYPDGTFRPNAPITRAEFAKMAVSFYDEAHDYAADAFPDISDHWAKNYINCAAELGIIQGYEDGTFRPGQMITRAEAMQIMNNVLGRYPHKDHLLDGMITWDDNMNPDAWYYAAVQAATNSHDYKYDAAAGYDIWTSLLPVRDWAALERKWSNANS